MMRRCAVMVVAAATAVAFASAAGAGSLHLAWDACGALGVRDQAFACDANTGADQLVVSFVAPAGAAKVVAVVASLTVGPPAGGRSLPAWWDFRTGGCRAGDLGLGLPGASGACEALWPGTAASGWREWIDGPWPGGPVVGPIPNTALLRLLGTMSPQTVSLTEGHEYATFVVNVSHLGTVGPDSCAGCAEPLSITLQAVELDQVVGDPTLMLTDPTAESTVTWRGGGPVVPAEPMTWGRVKQLYR